MCIIYILKIWNFHQATPLVAGLAVATVAYAGKYSIQAWNAFKARPPTVRMRKFYEGGFQATMTRREAALILGVRYPHNNLAVFFDLMHGKLEHSFTELLISTVLCLNWSGWRKNHRYKNSTFFSDAKPWHWKLNTSFPNASWSLFFH